MEEVGLVLGKKVTVESPAHSCCPGCRSEVVQRSLQVKRKERQFILFLTACEVLCLIGAGFSLWLDSLGFWFLGFLLAGLIIGQPLFNRTTDAL